MRKGMYVVLSVVLVLLAVQPARAEGALILTDAQIDGIRENCTKSIAALQQLHTADTLLRVNLGQRYENISLRLMAPLNARVAVNNMDGVELTKLTVQYNQAIKNFSDTYSDYDASIKQAMKSKCTSDPIEYYQLIEKTRVDRAKVHQSVVAIDKLLSQYKAAFEAFAVGVKS